MPISDCCNTKVLLTVLIVGVWMPLAAESAAAFGAKVAGEDPVIAVSSNIVDVKSAVEGAAAAPVEATLALPAIPQVEKERLGPDELFVQGLVAYRAGDGVLTVQNWTEAAEQGHIVAQWNLARLYRRNDLVAPDAKLAVHYLRSVANRHDPNRVRDTQSAMTIAALVELADVYKRGEPEAGIDPNPPQAARLYRLAATLYGSARAQHQLGMMYLSGDGVSQHIGRAMKWLALSARKRYVPSLAALGDFFWSQRETGNNKVQGLMWLSLARDNAKHDDLRAIVENRYDEALTEANDEERERAMALIQTWNQAHAAQ